MHETAWFAPRPASVADARHWLTANLERHDRRTVAPDAELCLSELAANAVGHAGTRFRVDVSDADDGVRIAVHDLDDSIPHPGVATPREVTGRGLQIVDAVAAAWGVIEQAPHGKTVWCIVDDEGAAPQLGST